MKQKPAHVISLVLSFQKPCLKQASRQNQLEGFLQVLGTYTGINQRIGIGRSLGSAWRPEDMCVPDSVHKKSFGFWV